MKLQTAREQVITMLDDADGQRWPIKELGDIFDPTNEVDLSIQSAAIECISSYVHQGGDMFDVVQEVTTDSDGTFSFLSQTDLPNVPLMLESCSYKGGDYYYSLHAIREQDVQLSLNEIVTVKVKLVYSPDLTKISGNDELYYSRQISYVPTIVPISWPVFDQWVCVVAAKGLTPKENEANSQLDDKVSMLSSACLRSPDQPKTVIFPSKERYLTWGPSLYRWSYVPRDLTAGKQCCLRLHKVRIR
jgi:hypothetical protein